MNNKIKNILMKCINWFSRHPIITILLIIYIGGILTSSNKNKSIENSQTNSIGETISQPTQYQNNQLPSHDVYDQFMPQNQPTLTNINNQTNENYAIKRSPAPTDEPTPTPYIYPTAVPTQHQPEHISCYQSGNMTYCNNGTSYRTENNQGSNDSYTTQGSDGSYSHTNGNYTYGSDGSSSTRIGNYTYGTDGSTCSKIGSFINCDKP
jgi:hypothetical protein